MIFDNKVNGFGGEFSAHIPSLLDEVLVVQVCERHDRYEYVHHDAEALAP